MSVINEAVRRAIAEANAKILRDLGAAFSGIEAREGERLTEYAAMYYGMHRYTDESDDALRARCQGKQRSLFGPSGEP